MTSTVVFSDIVGVDLSAVTFVRDYVQIHFDGPLLSAITMPVVVTSGKLVTPRDPGYRDALCGMIGKVVRSGSAVEGDRLALVFDDDSMITISLRPEDYRTAEAATYRDQAGGLWVW